MTIIAPPSYGMPVPARLHAVSVQIPTWQDICSIGLGDHKAMKGLKNGYPRSYVHITIQKLLKTCEQRFIPLGFNIILFSHPDAATACKTYMVSKALHGEKAASEKNISLCSVVFRKPDDIETALILPTVHAVVFPTQSFPLAALFWRLTGTGISSRLSERCLEALSNMRRLNSLVKPMLIDSHLVYEVISQRIANLMERSPINPCRISKVTSRDVYFYPSGMAAIYHIHHLLLDWRGAESVILGFTYELTLKILEVYGPSHRFHSAGTDEDIDNFERYLGKIHSQNKKIQAVWCECPSNPLLRTVDLKRVRRLADKYDFIVVIDDTIGSFANVDVLEIADIVITSLTKSFNGFADVLAGSAVLNPNSRYYNELKCSLNASYLNNLHIDDARQLEINSRSFLQRAARLNDTAAFLVDQLLPVLSDANSGVIQIYYPKLCWSSHNYIAQMRPPNDDFTPSFGGLFTIEFQTVKVATAFLDSLELHKGPSLGADVTLALPYVQLVFQKEKEWAARHGVKETIVRISVGLEDREAILKCIKRALVAASKTKIGIR